MDLRLVSQFDVQPDPARRDQARESLQHALDAGELPFATLPSQDETVILAIEHLARRFRERFRTFVIVGIGGSDLGTRAVHRALNHQFYNLVSDRRLFFVGDTTDPVALQEVMDLLKWDETGVVVVSKSGNTIETMTSFLFLRDHLKQKVGAHKYVDHIAVITDPETGIMRDIVQEEGYASLPHPTVGGRFSVLSAVGLLPLALAGVSIRELLTGANQVIEDHCDVALEYASLQHAAYEAGRHIQVLMPYTYGLREVGFWFRQLWAESLGKAVNRGGQEIHIGPTPIAAIGPTDQHSQVQLYREGPDDKTFTFITVKETEDLQVPDDIPSVESIQYLKGLSMNKILQAEQAGTEQALREVGRPTCCLELGRLDAEHLGGLLMFFELATAYAGELFDIDAFDQPGVERGKIITHSRLTGEA